MRSSATTQATRVLVLGSTGSIGTQTLDVLEHLNTQAGRDGCRGFEVVGLAGGQNFDLLKTQSARFGVKHVAIATASGETPEGWLVGEDAAERLVNEVDADIVVAAIVGSAGLGSTLAAARLGRTIALSNKETLVAAGEVITAVCAQTGAKLLPVDSEHSALWQALLSLDSAYTPPTPAPSGVAKLVLTASGGPFRTWDIDRLRGATPEEALAHPTWNMGDKITIDCASMTNKALEVIEAHWLFGTPSDRIEIVVHPQSIVHSLVENVDGSVMAQLGTPDMRTPIQLALTFPDRIAGTSGKLDLAAVGRLDFFEPDTEKFPALSVVRDVIDAGGSAGAVFNAANERAVEAFLNHEIPFGRMVDLPGEAVAQLGASAIGTLDDVLEADAAARAFVADAIHRGHQRIG